MANVDQNPVTVEYPDTFHWLKYCRRWTKNDRRRLKNSRH